ncbi:MAG TPA: amino acid ABC transporter permease [Hyphomicrobiaceae bacterium]|jgi:His/Glu/Gln/Arg/opine family amino acid ABC transporter permease subunit|nr:amino acid ABC transporter permease [Hyphomicrobiaceae bacterium]
MSATWFSSVVMPLLEGLALTVELALVVLAIGTVWGLIGGVLSVLGGPILRGVFTALIFMVRGVPLLIQVFVVFYLLPLWGLKLSAFATAALALSVFATATIVEIVRGGIEAIPSGQTEAAMAVGFSRIQTMRFVVLPQAMRSMMPALITQFVLLVKATSIVSLLGVPELMMAGREVIERTLLGLPVMAMIWLLYSAICYPLTVFGRRLEGAMARRGFQPVAR